MRHRSIEYTPGQRIITAFYKTNKQKKGYFDHCAKKCNQSTRYEYYTKAPLEAFLFFDFFSLLSQILDFSLWPIYTVVNISSVHTISDESCPISKDLMVVLFENILEFLLPLMRVGISKEALQRIAL